MSKTKKKPMKQGRRKRGVSKGMESAMAHRRERPERPRRLPEKDNPPRSPSKGRATGPDRSRATGARTKRKTASPRRNAK